MDLRLKEKMYLLHKLEYQVAVQKYSGQNRRKKWNFFVTKIVEDSDVTYNLTVAGYVALAAVMLVVFATGCMFRDKIKNGCKADCILRHGNGTCSCYVHV